MDPEEMKRKMREDVIYSLRNFLIYVALLRATRVCTTSLRVIVDPGPPILHSISGKAEDNTYLFITR
ncbi:hypothetical protein CCH79_00006082 [Gambusia affinis]|uniref:Uncharacterized protein n=1 Tax=Gambusia affinis TaxID=33528 RepID=A0A315VJA5_GAMAF|nr:hypothetical protein CCH79_00006082 [Gambusia affinis]